LAFRIDVACNVSDVTGYVSTNKYPDVYNSFVVEDFMALDPQPRSTVSFKGTAGLIVAVAVVAILLIAFPAYRWFFAISVGIGIGVALVLFLWHKLRPIREEDIENKRPLGLK
jgi:fatty acid desaturase